MTAPERNDQSIEDFIPTRRSLLSRLKNWDDQESWRDFFDTYGKLIYGLAVKSGFTDAEAQDILQETLLSVAKRMPNFQYDPAIGSFKGWLTNHAAAHGDQWRNVPTARRAQLEAGTDTERIPEPASQPLDVLWDQVAKTCWRWRSLA